MSLAREILKQKKQELLARVAEIRKDIRDLDAALELLGEGKSATGVVFASVGGVVSVSAFANAGPSPINTAILEAISHGNGTPEAIYLFVRDHMQIDTTKNSISTRLSKLKNDGLIENDGQGWALVEKAEGPGAVTPEPSNAELGPVGRGTALPASHPEGSNPSGSTASQTPIDDWDDIPKRQLDDEIPF